MDQELERREVVQQESKKAGTGRTRDNTFIGKAIIGQSTAAAAPPCSNEEFWSPQLSGVMPAYSVTRTLASTNMNIVDNTTSPETRSTTAKPLAGLLGTTANVLVDASMVGEYKNLRKDLKSEKRIIKYIESSESCG